MKTCFFVPALLALAFALGGCVVQTPYDYGNFRAHPPRSIVVFPPLNQSTDVNGTYGYLSTVTQPLAEKGYYVYPVMVIDQFMKENGQPDAVDMQQVPLNKIREILGADAVLYLTLKDYGTKYQIINSVTAVTATATLVDVQTGLTLWNGAVDLRVNASGGSGNLIADLVATAIDQIINSSTDHAHKVSRIANVQMLMDKNRGLLDGPYAVKK
jgi:hypothetical protein